MEPEGSAGVKAGMGSQQMQGMMVHELLEAWPIEELREAGKDKADIKRSAVGCQVLKRKRSWRGCSRELPSCVGQWKSCRPGEARGFGLFLCGQEMEEPSVSSL